MSKRNVKLCFVGDKAAGKTTLIKNSASTYSCDRGYDCCCVKCIRYDMVELEGELDHCEPNNFKGVDCMVIVIDISASIYEQLAQMDAIR